MTPDHLATLQQTQGAMSTLVEENPSNISATSSVLTNISATSHRSNLPLPMGANDPFFVMGELKTLEKGYDALIQMAGDVIDILEEEDYICIWTEQIQDHFQTVCSIYSCANSSRLIDICQQTNWSNNQLSHKPGSLDSRICTYNAYNTSDP